jgi:hypothetical protein
LVSGRRLKDDRERSAAALLSAIRGANSRAKKHRVRYEEELVDSLERAGWAIVPHSETMDETMACIDGARARGASFPEGY